MIKPKLSLVPDYSFKCITDITPEFLRRVGIKFLMLDLDNTIAAYDEHILADNISKWIFDIQNSGIDLFIISNSTRKKRVKSHSDSIGVRFITKSKKPSTKSLLHAMEVSGHNPDTSALAGDQILTDTIAANRTGIISIIVRPRRFTNPFLAVRYYCEVPFRAMCKNKY
jgi:hypothetical protein